ncbi:serine hydrolase domain-containing protein [Leifsonia poae]|uniref:serine hydrolase domain-containing protein n=1 Tax=Leifsonia poae TaxID=110933 RepID=UPI001CBD355E|nr:serine hydrolase domain-containing protein [Leifsonia poae]
MGNRRRSFIVVAAAGGLGLALLSGCAGSGGPHSAVPASAGPTATSLPTARIAAAVDDTIAAAGIPGAAVRITRAEGAVPWVHATGDAVLDPKRAVKADDRFAYRSITKSFTVTVVLQLVDEKKVGLDDPISRFVPGVPSGNEITIRELAGMRSGLVNYSATPSVQSGLQADPTRAWTDDELLAAAFAQPLDFAPGTAYEYSNTNTVLLGRVIEAVTGHPWAQEVAARLTTPLGLGSISYPGNGAMASPAAAPYQVGGRGAAPEALPAVSFALFSAAGGLTGTVGDLDGWARALGTGKTLKAATFAERTAQLSKASTDPKGPLYDSYGLGVGVIRGWIGHTGVGIGYQCLAMYDPKTGMSVAMVMNGTGDDPDVPARLFERILPLLG